MLIVFFLGLLVSIEANQCTCDIQWDPICASDSKTYNNACAATKCVQPALTDWRPGECSSRENIGQYVSCTCGEYYLPVCAATGIDCDNVVQGNTDVVGCTAGTTYWNPCQARCAGHITFTAGPCPYQGCGANQACPEGNNCVFDPNQGFFCSKVYTPGAYCPMDAQVDLCQSPTKCSTRLSEDTPQNKVLGNCLFPVQNIVANDRGNYEEKADGKQCNGLVSKGGIPTAGNTFPLGSKRTLDLCKAAAKENSNCQHFHFLTYNAGTTACFCGKDCRAANQQTEAGTKIYQKANTVMPADPDDIFAQPQTLTCYGRCGETSTDANTCDCGPKCVEYGDCCNDYFDVCKSDTCENRCNSKYSSTSICSCHSDCDKYDDCCADRLTKCSSLTVIATCDGRCGGIGKNVVKGLPDCFCDIKCMYKNDCCGDFTTQCPKEVEEAKYVTKESEMVQTLWNSQFIGPQSNYLNGR